jgi:signal transduction histidine kinase
MWQYQEMLPYPITIFDRSTALTVAMPESFTEETFQPSAKYRPRPFDGDIFPWYVVYFSQQTGLDFERNATNEKIVYYFLIAAANICMIAAVIGALRDIARELHLSDMRTNFVARVSHELRTPLGLIHLFAETLEMGRVANEEKRQEYLHAITKESERLSHLINNILNFSQIEADRKLYSMSPQLVDEIVAEAAETLQYHLQRHEMQMDLQIEEDLPPVSCDRDAIGQVLYNLISNAVKYSSEGSTITLRAFQDAGWVTIQVADEGIGISNEYREKIFQQFFRLEKDPMVQKTGGSGLGLTVVKHIVQAHHGQISVDSQPGQGSTFTVKLPVMQSATAKTRASAPDIS